MYHRYQRWLYALALAGGSSFPVSAAPPARVALMDLTTADNSYRSAQRAANLTIEIITLSYSGTYRAPKDGQSLFDKTRTPLWPCGWTPDGLLVSGSEGNRRLYLLTDALAEQIIP
jgi:hypothetical protein